jgi:hypothetical protein
MPTSDDILAQALGLEGGQGTSNPDRFRLSHFITAAGCWTLFISVSTLLFQPPRGVMFEGHTHAYYIILLGLAVVGAAEICAGVFLQYSGAPHRIGKTLAIAASILVLIICGTIGGFAFTKRP